MRSPEVALLLLSALGQALSASAEQCHLRVGSKGAHTAAPGVSGTASLASSASPTATSAPVVSQTPFKYGTDVVRGVNLGGWFVLEPWITPSIFQNTGNDDIVDEWTFGQLQDNETATSALTDHWNTWITEEDFVNISAAGLNHVRIPLGYWSVPLTAADTNFTTSHAPYTAGAWPYFLQALNWAKAHNVHVIVDLHGAPGSQNGFDNSGQRTSDLEWPTKSPNGTQVNVQRTLEVLRFIAKNAGGMIDVLELLNEPAGFTSSSFASTVRQFWQDGYDVVREAVGTGLHLMIGDAFLTVDNWTNFLTPPSAQGVIMDNHEYQIFSWPELERSFAQHITFACNNTMPDLTKYAKSNLITIVGEWSTALTDCAQWLNGRGVGARWDGTWFPGSPSAGPTLGGCGNWTGSMSGFSSQYKTWLRQYWEAQVTIGESVQGWVYWTWKAENADEWSYSKGLEGGWIPSDPTDRLYPNICSGVY